MNGVLMCVRLKVNKHSPGCIDQLPSWQCALQKSYDVKRAQQQAYPLYRCSGYSPVSIHHHHTHIYISGRVSVKFLLIWPLTERDAVAAWMEPAPTIIPVAAIQKRMFTIYTVEMSQLRNTSRKCPIHILEYLHMFGSCADCVLHNVRAYLKPAWKYEKVHVW